MAREKLIAVADEMRRRLVRSARRVRDLIAPRYPGWARILGNDRTRWQRALTQSSSGPRVLIATSVGGHEPMVIMESALAAALTLRGANPHVFLCDHSLPACMKLVSTEFADLTSFVESGPSRDTCRLCFEGGLRTYRQLGVKVESYNEYLSPEDRREAQAIAEKTPLSEIGSYHLEDLAIGEHALAGALRFYARGTLEGEPQGEAVLRRFFEASLLTAFATRKLLSTHTFDVAVFHHGIYVPQGVIGEVLRHANVPVVTWNPAYKKQCFIFSHRDTYHHTLRDEPVDAWQHLELSPKMEADLLGYLKSREQGTRDWIWFHENPELNISIISEQLGLDFAKPTIGLLTNVVWDAQLHYRANAFSSMMEWLLATVGYFAKRSDLQLVIRIHPAEIRGTLPSRQKVADEIHSAWPQLPGNVYVVGPESRVSTYAAMHACDAVLIYGTKTGVELTSMGIPVIVAGEAWIRNKGVTLDAGSAKEYFFLLDRLPHRRRLDDATVARARKYAYHFFFRRMIPLSFMEPTGAWPPYRLRLASIDSLAPGRDRGLDVICDGILAGGDFIYRGENHD